MLCATGVFAASACGGPEQVNPIAEAPKLLYRGCRVVQETAEGPVCFPSALSRTVLWVAGPSCEDFELTEDDKPVAVEKMFFHGGCELLRTDQSPLTRSTLALRRRSTNEKLWQMPVNRSMPQLFELTDRVFRRDANDLETIAVASPWIEASTAQDTPERRIDKACALARSLVRQGKTSQGLAALADCRELATQAGYSSMAAEAAFYAAHMLEAAGLADEAALELEKIKSTLTPQLALGQMNWAKYSAYISLDLERFTDAEAWIARAIQNIERVGDKQNAELLFSSWAEMLIDLDRFDEARQVIANIETGLATLPQCMRANRFVQLGWLNLKLEQEEQNPTQTLSS